MTARLLIALTALLIVVGTNSPAQGQKEKAATRLTHMVVLPDDIKWVDGPPGLPAGVKVAVLDGDPSKSGANFTLRAKMPDGYTVPPHWHSVDEVITVIEGSMGIGIGEKLDKSKVRYMPAGTFMKMNKGEKHFAIAKGETIIQVNSPGPFDINYVNPNDDPRKK
jgi:hypothetical protein